MKEKLPIYTLKGLKFGLLTGEIKENVESYIWQPLSNQKKKMIIFNNSNLLCLETYVEAQILLNYYFIIHIQILLGLIFNLHKKSSS